MLVLGLGFSSSPNNQNIPRTDRRRRALLAAATHRTVSSLVGLHIEEASALPRVFAAPRLLRRCLAAGPERVRQQPEVPVARTGLY